MTSNGKPEALEAAPETGESPAPAEGALGSLGRLFDVLRRPPTEPLEIVEEQQRAALDRLSGLFDGAVCYPFFRDTAIGPDTVDEVYDALRATECAGRLVVLVDSAGGDLHAAYNLALLFRQFGRDDLTVIVPRWAKSAATLVSCSGDRLLMTPVSELGPLDPQIMSGGAMDKHFGPVSPLHIESTLELIRNEFSTGSERLAEALTQRLQFPLTLGAFKKSLETGQEYLRRLLVTRMLKGCPEQEVARIAHNFTVGYTDHGSFIGLGELEELGLVVEGLEGERLATVWDIHLLNRKRRDLERQRKARANAREPERVPAAAAASSPGAAPQAPPASPAPPAAAAAGASPAGGKPTGEDRPPGRS